MPIQIHSLLMQEGHHHDLLRLCVVQISSDVDHALGDLKICRDILHNYLANYEQVPYASLYIRSSISVPLEALRVSKIHSLIF